MLEKTTTLTLHDLVHAYHNWCALSDGTLRAMPTQHTQDTTQKVTFTQEMLDNIDPRFFTTVWQLCQDYQMPRRVDDCLRATYSCWTTADVLDVANSRMFVAQWLGIRSDIDNPEHVYLAVHRYASLTNKVNASKDEVLVVEPHPYSLGTNLPWAELERQYPGVRALVENGEALGCTPGEIALSFQTWLQKPPEVTLPNEYIFE